MGKKIYKIFEILKWLYIDFPVTDLYTATLWRLHLEYITSKKMLSNTEILKMYDIMYF